MPKSLPPQNFSLEQLEQLFNAEDRQFDIYLYKSTRWCEWENPVFSSGDAKVMKVDPEEDWPLFVSFTGAEADTQPIPFDGEMQFVCKARS